MPLQLWRRLLVAAAAILVLVAVARAYAPAQKATFIWDDHILAEQDARFRHAPLGDVMTGPFWPDTPLADAWAPYYRPVVLISLRLDMLAGGTAETFHRTNILIHLLGCALVAIVAVRLGARATSALVAALVWGLAPRLSESVVWISGRTDLLAGALGLAALAISPDVTAKPAARTPAVKLALASLSGVLLFGALASKEVAIAFAAAIAIPILHARRTEGLSRQWLTRLLANVALPVMVYVLLRSVALHGLTASPRALGPGRRLATALEVVGRYAEMLVDPLHPQTMIGTFGEIDVVRAIVGAVVLVALVVASVRLRRRTPIGVRVAMAIAAVALGLVLHLVPFTLAGAVAADRLLYVPLAGFAIGLVVALEMAHRHIRLVAGVLAFGLAALSMTTTKARAAEYQDEVLFWVVAAERAPPHNTTPLSSLANVVREAGETEHACRLYERASAILSSSARAGLAAHRRTRENLVSCWATVGRYNDALRLAEELARAYPESGRVRMGLGFARLHVLDFDGAAEAFTASTTMEPALARIVQPALEDLALARKDAPFFADPARRTERARYARYLARIGHLPEAEVVHLAVAEDATAPRDERLGSLAFLVTHGRLPLARRALEVTASLPVDLTDAHRTLAIREQRSERVARVSARIEALA